MDGRLHDVDRRDGVERAEAPCLAEALGKARRQGASPDLDDHVVDRDAGVGDLVAERPAAVDREPVVGPLARERHRTRGDRLSESVHARIAWRIAVVSGTHLDRGAELAEAIDHGRVGPRRYVHGEGARRRLCDHCSGECSVAAAGDGQGT